MREEGYRVILVNSNPATIMTDPEMADATYIEPINWEVVRKIIEKERPDAVLPTMGGQTALNCALELERQGVLEEFGVTMIGATADAIDKAEDRRRFDVAMKKIGLDTARSGIAHTMEEALAVAADVGFPCIIRPSFTMGLILGAGPIVIGQACEFDYSGAQACKALREEGYRVILVNSNPATIMTDPEMADATYIEPIHWEVVRKIIEKERPDAVLPTMGGQTALNCALELERQGVLAEFGVTMIGATADAIDKAEDRRRFDIAMKKIGLDTARSGIAHTMEEALAVAADVGFPCIIRPSFTMGGTGGGIAYNREEFEEICERGLDLSPTNELLIDESLIGWKEYEMEVVRDKNDNCIIVCSIENFDAMGIHTGDSITVAPAQTLTDKEYQIMRNASMAVLREIGVETGGSNVQFAVNPKNGRLIVIEMNPRVSRSSALASKATGFPIAKVAAKLAVGYTLDELMNDITGGRTPASFEPSIDYVVTKIPRFNFEKFAGANDRLTTQMKSVGEVMAIGRTQQESLQKALRGLEVGATSTAVRPR